jgi:hypothetical protein
LYVCPCNIGQDLARLSASDCFPPLMVG